MFHILWTDHNFCTNIIYKVTRGKGSLCSVMEMTQEVAKVEVLKVQISQNITYLGNSYIQPTITQNSLHIKQ